MEYDYLTMQHTVTGHDKNAIHLFNMIFIRTLITILRYVIYTFISIVENWHINKYASWFLVYRISNMLQIQRFLNLVASNLFDKYIHQAAILIFTATCLLVSNTSFAFVIHPIAKDTCSNNTTKGSLSNLDYARLLASNGSYMTTDGSANIPLQIQLSTKESSNTTVASTSLSGTTANQAIRFVRDFPNSTSYSDITFNFQNSETGEALFLNNVALSIFDIDKAITSSSSSSNGWNDYVKVTGITKNGAINSTFQTIGGSSIEFNTSSIGSDTFKGLRLPADSTNTFNCRDALDTSCQGSIYFSDPVKSVTLRYSNASTITNPSGQVIDVRLENYCHTPNSIFSGIVFNDNGGIAADAGTKQDITSKFVGNSKYFNGIYDSSDELGIYDSKLNILLTDCNGNSISTISPNPQTVSDSSSSRGKYSFTVAASKLENRTKVCLIESEPSIWDYIIDTTSDNKEVSLTTNIYAYNNLDFGEVQANNASLVLIKSQYVHTCNNALNFSTVVANPQPDNPINGFSIKSPTSDVEPGKCIAYRIEAYNRGHVDLKEIQINDQLQVKSQTNLVTSVFALPVPKGDPTSLYTGTTLPTGTITSELFNLNKPIGSTPTKATLYFNTKYGTTVNAQ